MSMKAKDFVFAFTAIFLLGGGIYLYANKTKKNAVADETEEGSTGISGGGGGGSVSDSPQKSVPAQTEGNGETVDVGVKTPSSGGGKAAIDKPIMVYQPPQNQTSQSETPASNQQQQTTGHNNQTQPPLSNVGVGITGITGTTKKKYNMQATTTLAGSGKNTGSMLGLHNNAEGSGDWD